MHGGQVLSVNNTKSTPLTPYRATNTPHSPPPLTHHSSSPLTLLLITPLLPSLPSPITLLSPPSPPLLTPLLPSLLSPSLHALLPSRPPFFYSVQLCFVLTWRSMLQLTISSVSIVEKSDALQACGLFVTLHASQPPTLCQLPHIVHPCM